MSADCLAYPSSKRVTRTSLAFLIMQINGMYERQLQRPRQLTDTRLRFDYFSHDVSLITTQRLGSLSQIRLSGKSLVVRVTGADPVETVKATFQSEAEAQGAEDDVAQPYHLTFGGKTLADGKTVSDYGSSA